MIEPFKQDIKPCPFCGKNHISIIHEIDEDTGEIWYYEFLKRKGKQ